MKTSVFSRVRSTSENLNVFITRDEITYCNTILLYHNVPQYFHECKAQVKIWMFSLHKMKLHTAIQLYCIIMYRSKNTLHHCHMNQYVFGRYILQYNFIVSYCIAVSTLCIIITWTNMFLVGTYCNTTLLYHIVLQWEHFASLSHEPICIW